VALRAEEIEDPGTVDLDRDRKLVLRYQRGDEGAFDELYRRYYPRLHLYCQRRVGDAHVSEELAQEAFLRALRAMPRFAGERRFYPWMTVIAQRLCIDHHRRSARVEPTPEVDLGFVEPDHDAVFAEVDKGHLEIAMARLAPRHREVLELREQQGWSYHQIADHLDVPITTVEALLHRARKALKREFLAVSGGGRLASLPIVGWALLRIGRIRTRYSGRTLSQLVPFAGSAAAGLAAVTLVFTPMTGASSAPVTTAAQSANAASSTTSTPAVIDTPPVVDVATPPPPVGPPPASGTANAPPPVVNAGVAQVYHGDQAVEWGTQQNEQQPVNVEVPNVVGAGVDPGQIVDDVTSYLPGGNK
jgi:RNA polymerase sigma-70 factor (ECF subfamily)